MNAIQTLGDAVSKLGKQINDLQREVAGRRSHAHRLSIELKQSEIEREKLESSFRELRSSVDSERDEIEQELQLANDAIARLESSNNALAADCNARQQQVIQATVEIDRLRKNLESAEAARNDLELQYRDLSIELETMTNERDSLIRDKESLVDELKALQFTIEKRNEAILDAIVHINSLPADMYDGDENLIPVAEALLSILKQGSQK